MSDTSHTINFTRRDGVWYADGNPAKTFKTECKKDKGEQTVICQIGTPTGQYMFTRDPIWIRRGTDMCPGPDDEVDAVSVKKAEATQLTLKYRNNNPEEEQFRYQLNVWDKVNREYAVIDPILTNTGR